MSKVSVIIPIYGVEKYIERCARSLFEQTLDDIEYLFVDDCTPDNSVEIVKRVLKDYPQRSSQVFIHRMNYNSGQAKVREWGIRNATGDYVIHCDSDDWVDVNMYKSMYEDAINKNVDIVVCDFISTDGIKNKRYYGMSGDVTKIIPEIFTWKSTAVLWNKLIKRELFIDNPIIYPEGNMGEDFVLSIQLIYYSKGKITYLPEPYYYYFDNSHSITRVLSETTNLRKYNQAVANIKCIEPFLEEKGVILQYKDEWDFFKHMQRNTIGILIKNKKYRQMWRRTFSEINFRMLFSKYLTVTQRVKLLFTYLGLRVGL